jgi:signal transduction histidine kinase
MALTQDEKNAIVRDIQTGMKQVIEQLKGLEKALPLAINHLNPHATGTRKLLKAAAKLCEARREFESLDAWDIKVKE